MGRDPGKEIFEISRTDTSSPKKWVEEVEAAASQIRGKQVSFTSLEQIADVLTNNHGRPDFGHGDLSKYPSKEMKKPPCSIAQAANGGPLNCVGRIATVVTIAEVKNLNPDLYRNVLIGTNILWKGLAGDKRVEDGHIYGFVRGTGGDKKYLGKPVEMNDHQKHRIDMLPAFYRANLALAVGLEGNEKKAKKMAKKARKEAPNKSAYLNYFTDKIINY